jgi:hypothetical protein
MFRDDRNAMLQRLDALQRETDALRGENAAMREELLARNREGSQGLVGRNVYESDLAQLSPGERAALARHQLRRFPAWLVALLTPLTLGLFPLIHFGLQHDRLPTAHDKDPTGAKAIGYSFVPYYNLYWVLFNTLRLADRIDLQYRLRGEAGGAPRGMLLACAIATIPALLHPFFLLYFIAAPVLLVLWAIGGGMLQASINRLADVDTPPQGLIGEGPRLPELPGSL